MGINNFTVGGFIGYDPELKKTQTGDSVCNFTVACSEGKRGTPTKHTSWYRVSAWGKLAELCAEYLKKGSLCVVSGRLSLREYDDQKRGHKWISADLRASDVQFMAKVASKEQNAAEPTQTDFSDVPM